MKLAQIEDYISDPEQRVKECLVAILDDVSKDDWASLQKLNISFHDSFDIFAMLLPIVDGKEVHVIVTEPTDVSGLNNMAYFVSGWVAATSNK